MENLEVMVILFIIVILGYVACKLGYMGDKFDKKLSSMVVDIDLKHSENVRRWWPFLRDRRIENYGDITRRFID